MTQRFLLSTLLLTLVVSAPAAQRATDGTGESWIFSSDESGSGSSYLGVDIADVTTERLSELKLKEEHGAEVTMVDQDAPAGKAGLHEHDVILSVNGSGVESAAQLRRMIKETPPGRVVSLGISRDGQPMTIKVQLADRKKSVSWTPENHEYKFEMPAMPAIPDIDIPISVVIAHSSLRSGLVVENITPQLGDFFGVKGGKGVLVRTVEKNSRGEKAGFHAGDVIVKVNEQLVHDSSDFTHALRESRGESATITVVRDKREQTFTITLPVRKDSGRVMDESMDEDEYDVSADTELAIDRSASALARLTPEVLEKAEKEMDQAGEALEKAQDDCKDNVEDEQQNIEKRIEDQEERLRDQEKMMQDRQQKLRHEMSGEWTEI
jgi:membrane-associated protease RseP (regulator of RpoE activity)